MARYIVTGSAGFISARVVDLLLEAEHQVVGVDNLNDAYDIRLKHWRLNRHLANPAYTFEKLDIASRTDLDALAQRLGKVDAVINLAARAGVRSSVADPWSYYDTNVTGALNMLELCRQLNIPKFVHASSSSVYGDNNPMPYYEDANTDLPLQPYAASKKASEVLAYTYHYLHGLDVTVFRYFTVYGPAARPDMAMFRFTQWIAEGKTVKMNGDGEQSRGFTYVDDIARGTILGLQPTGFEIFNLGGHEVITMNNLIHLFESKLHKQAHLEFQARHMADALGNYADVTKAKQKLNWKPEVGLDEGVSRLVDWYLKEQTWASQVVTG